jgi:hypothetical protein
MHTQAFDQSDGLSSTQITDFYQDSRGIIWLGTSYGLNSYNGAEFKSYKKENGLAHNYILEISEDNLGNLWIRSGDFSASKYFITIYLADSDTFSSLENYIGSDYPFNGGDIKVHKQTLGSNIICEKFDGKHWFYELKNKKVHKLFNVPFEEDKIPSLIHARRFDDNIYRFIFFKILDGNNLLGLQYEYDLKASQLTQLDINAYTNDTGPGKI